MGLHMPKITSPKPSLPKLLVAAAVAGPVGAVAVLALEHKDEINSTLGSVGAEVKKDAGVVKQDTIAVAKDAGNGIKATAITAGNDIKAGAKSVEGGLTNIYWYGMAGAGVLLALKISGVF